MVIALIDALREAVGGNSEAERVAAGHRVIAALATVPVPRSTGRRGRRPVHDRDVAIAHLIGIAGSIDGLPECQADIVEILRERLAADWPEVPGDTWLKDVVSEFMAGRRARDDLVIQKYNSSHDLQLAFSSPGDYLKFRNIRFGIEEQWLHDATLRARFATAADYFLSVIEAGSSSPAELATIRG